ncbi:MAG TPA: hypothetical protein VE177_07195, partial [Candidatus Binatus sp.]|nr:hypothetical protein [Candidatus Binatus sp.]
SIPLYMYTEKDSLNRITILKETAKENFLIAGRYASAGPEGRFYSPLTPEERVEIEKMLRGSHREAAINFL